MKFTRLLMAGMATGMALFVVSCSKQDAPKTPADAAIATIPKDSVLTPFGMRHKSQVHHVAEGTELTYQNNHLVQINSKTRMMVQDFGEQKSLGTGAKVTFSRNATPTVPTLGAGWITDASDNSPEPYDGFTTDWIVPANPPTYHSQLVYLFNGLQDGFTATSHILQPVLQFGSNGAWGGNYWTIDNWYASCGTCAAYYGTAVTVSPGTHLQGSMYQSEAFGAGVYSYSSTFTYLTGTGPYRVFSYPASNAITVTHVPQMLYAFETLEAYNMQVSTDYPNGSCSMFDIYMYMKNGGRRPTVYTPTWTANNLVTDVGQHTTVVSPSQVDIYFH